MRFRLQYDRDASDVERRHTQIHTGTDTIVQRSFAKDADINELVRRFGLLGRVPEPVLDPAYYGDVEDIPDLRTALDRVRDAQERFMALPSKVRARFQNDPAKLSAFVSDEENFDEAVKLGLVKRREPAPVTPAPVPVNETSSAPPGAP